MISPKQIMSVMLKGLIKPEGFELRKIDSEDLTEEA